MKSALTGSSCSSSVQRRRTPHVCGGEACVVRTRIPVWVLEKARRLGASEAELQRAYPTLRAEDLVNAWADVRANRAEIEQPIRDNEEALRLLARRYANENFPQPVVEELRRFEHDVPTVLETGKAGQKTNTGPVISGGSTSPCAKSSRLLVPLPQ